MTLSPVSVDSLAAEPFLKDLIAELEDLYGQMDRLYAQKSAHYGFECTGCTENCCLTRFYHHTYLEYIYLRKGFAGLSASKQAAARQRAEAYLDVLAQSESGENGPPFRRMCPVNESGWCLLYAWRPMICRLHGIPHELAPPGTSSRVYGEGCAEFTVSCGHLPYSPFDRTPFYVRMSELEGRLRKSLAVSGKSKKTIAHMLVQDEVPVDAVY